MSILIIVDGFRGGVGYDSVGDCWAVACVGGYVNVGLFFMCVVVFVVDGFCLSSLLRRLPCPQARRTEAKTSWKVGHHRVGVGLLAPPHHRRQNARPCQRFGLSY